MCRAPIGFTGHRIVLASQKLAPICQPETQILVRTQFGVLEAHAGGCAAQREPAAAHRAGREVRLARFSLDPQYCGRLENFCQYTDLQARDPAEIETPGLHWLILVNQRPLHPYTQVERILNPWGWGSFPLSLRLDENAVLEFAVRNVSYVPPVGAPAITRVGARLVGRHWFNANYAEESRHA